MKRLYPLGLIIPALIGLTVYGISSGQLLRWWSILFRTHPVLDCPNVLEFGERELGELAVTRFSISNRGGQTLVIDDVQTSCSCSGLEQEQDGKFVRLQSLRVGPCDSVKVAMRAVVQGTPGSPARYVVTFRTNDPSRRAYAIESVVSKVKAGAVAVPNSVAFGKLSLLGDARRVIDIYDEAVNQRRIGKVASGSPGQIEARILNDAKPPADSGNPDFGKWIGRIEVVALTQTPGRIQTDVEVHLADELRPPTLIPVSGRVLGPLEISPSIVVLPRSSSAGWVYSALSLCRSTSGKPFDLAVESRPDDLNVLIESKTTAKDEKTVAIEWDRSKSGGAEIANPRKVRLLARIDGQETIVELTVHCLAKE